MNKKALQVLKTEQKQLDIDGIMVEVSRQALSTILDEFEDLQKRYAILCPSYEKELYESE